MASVEDRSGERDTVVVFGREVRRCRARRKRDGLRCTHPATGGYEVCRMHGANPKNCGGAPPEKMRGNLNGIKHGAYVKRLLDERDRELFEAMLESIRRDFVLNDSTDQVQASMAAFYYAKWQRAAEGGPESAIVTFDTLLRRQLESLKATRAQREAEKISGGSPAEWAVALLESVRRGKTPTPAGEPRVPAEDEPDLGR